MSTTAARPDARGLHDAFLATGEPGAQVRDVVASSWRRSRRSGVDPERPDPPVISDRELAELRAEHPLAAAIPTVRELLVAPEEGWIAALADTSGRLLWLEGDDGVRRQAESVGFVAGARWSEDCAGTNAPGTALATGEIVQLVGAEHYSRPVQALNCVAAPVHDAEGRVVGVLDITGGPAVATGLARSLVRAATAAVEAGLAARARSGRGGAEHDGDGLHDGEGRGWHDGARWRDGNGWRDGAEGSTRGESGGEAAASSSSSTRPALRVLGSRGARLSTPDGAVHLSRRHAEILLLLAEHPDGLAADELAVLLSDDDLSGVTVRAEVSRLRRVVGPLLAQARPYRLGSRLRTDVEAVRGALEAGDVAQALASCPGPVLARSQAPGIVAVREALQAELRAAVLASGDPALLARWTASDEGVDDWWAWQRLAEVAPVGGAQALRARARLTELDRTLG